MDSLHIGLLAAIALCALSGCALRRYRPSVLRSRVQLMEPLMARAGFRRVPLDTRSNRQAASGLRALHFNRLARNKRLHYYFFDPYYCNCVYAGDLLSYQKYQQLYAARRQRKTSRQAAIDARLNSQVTIGGQWHPTGPLTFP